jgi:hypothetical protein
VHLLRELFLNSRNRLYSGGESKVYSIVTRFRIAIRAPNK